MRYCSACHGAEGTGGGPVAGSLKAAPPDLTTLAARAGGKFPAKTVLQRIEGLDMPAAHGSSEMPVWGERFVAEELGAGVSLQQARKVGRTANRRIRRLVDYLKSVQK